MRQLICFAASAALIAATPASATTYYFLSSGFSGGATFSGSFDAIDADSNGQIVSFVGEVTAFSGSWSGNADVPAATFDFSGLFGLVWDFDALIGDNADGAIEGLLASSQDGNTSFAAGPGPFVLCDGVQQCAALQNAAGGFTGSIEGVQVSLRPFGAVPEPASWALMIAGFGLAGAALRRRVHMGLSFAQSR